MGASSGRVLVTGASGNVGRFVVGELLRRGCEVRAAGSSASSAAVDGVEQTTLDFLRAETFAPALRGCDRLFLMRPPAIANVRSTINPFLDVALASGVQHVVFLSVAGSGTNPLVPHYTVEHHLRARGASTTILRPGFFAQNVASAYATDIVEHARIYVPAAAGRVAFVDVRDVAEVAALALMTPAAHRGAIHTLTGPEAISFDDVAAILSAELGRAIRYEPARALGYLRHLHRRGLPAMQAIVQTVLHLGLRRGDAEQVDPTLERLLGRPPRTMREYVHDHAATWSVGSSANGR